MTARTRAKVMIDGRPVRILGRGLHAKRGVHLTLRGLRSAHVKTQLDIAEASGINQGDISRLESKADLNDCTVATLRRYIEALGGKLELVASFGNKNFTVVGVE